MSSVMARCSSPGTGSRWVAPPSTPSGQPPESAATVDRRRRLELGRKRLVTFETSNRYQSELKGTTLAMIDYMLDEWCGDERAEDFDRWWPIVGEYASVLFSRKLEGRGARQRLKRLLDRNQRRPSKLCEQWLRPYGQERGPSCKRLERDVWRRD